jgi:quinol monooxygenase YgiN
MSSQAKILAILNAKPGKEKELEALLRGMVAPSRQEPGNLRWDIWEEAGVPGRYILDELYKDDEAVAAHRQTPHFQHYLSLVETLAQRQAHVVRPVEVLA